MLRRDANIPRVWARPVPPDDSQEVRSNSLNGGVSEVTSKSISRMRELPPVESSDEQVVATTAPDWIQSEYPACASVRREAEVDWGGVADALSSATSEAQG